jgi:rhombotail lipoprotein
MKMLKPVVLLYVVLTAVMSSSCGGQQVRHKSSVVDYLYPNKSDLTVVPSIPKLNIPINVGVAFVPSQGSDASGRNYWTGKVNDSTTLTEAKKADLLKSIAGHFEQYEYVRNIEIIPSPYLTSGGGFNNLNQIKTMYGVDVIALVSYDQIQFTDEGALSLTYWTIVGAYVFSGEKNDTSTLMDTVVYDISSKKMLFRAPGTSLVKGSSTPVNLSEELREDSVKGFEVATQEMVANLDLQLSEFREKIKKRPEDVQITYSSDYSGGGGGGALGVLDIIFLFAASAFFVNRSRLKRTVQ